MLPHAQQASLPHLPTAQQQPHSLPPPSHSHYQTQQLHHTRPQLEVASEMSRRMTATAGTGARARSLTRDNSLDNRLTMQPQYQQQQYSAAMQQQATAAAMNPYATLDRMARRERSLSRERQARMQQASRAEQQYHNAAAMAGYAPAALYDDPYQMVTAQGGAPMSISSAPESYMNAGGVYGGAGVYGGQHHAMLAHPTTATLLPGEMIF